MLQDSYDTGGVDAARDSAWVLSKCPRRADVAFPESSQDTGGAADARDSASRGRAPLYTLHRGPLLDPVCAARCRFTSPRRISSPLPPLLAAAATTRSSRRRAASRRRLPRRA